MIRGNEFRSTKLVLSFSTQKIFLKKAMEREIELSYLNIIELKNCGCLMGKLKDRFPHNI